MGCGSSRAEESRVVSLCRQRKELIRVAMDRRYAFSAAHAAYLRALVAVGDSLERFVLEELAVAPSPVLTLPSDGKGKSKSVSSASGDGGGSVGGSSSVTPLSHSLSDDGSHLHLSSGSEVGASPESKRGGGDGGGGRGGGVESSFSPPRSASAASSPNYSFMRSSTAIPTMVYEEPNTQQWQHPSNSEHGYGYEYGYGFGYPPYGVPIGSPEPGKENSYYYGRPMSPPGSVAAGPSSPPPPPPPEGSAWEFLDLFNTYEQLLPEYGSVRYGGTSYLSSSPDSNEVRKKEGIPDLEDETEVAAMKEVRKEKKVVREHSGGKESSIGSYKTESTQEMGVKDEKNGKIGSEEKESKSSSVSSRLRSSGEDDGSSGKKKGVKFEEETSFVTEESRPSSAKALSTPSSGKSSSTPSNGKSMPGPSNGNALFAHGTRDVVEAVQEIKEHFNSAANYGEVVSRILEVGKLPYRSRNRMFRVFSSRIWRPMAFTMLTSSRPSFKRSRRSAASTIRRRASNGISEKHMDMKSGNLSSTLEKLYVWEKKLYKEVKEEEKLQSIYDKKYERLKALDRGGAEFSKIDSTQTSVRKLRTKISILIKSVDAISNRMHKIRDEELQPQLAELIQGLVKMWKSLLDCHRKQLQAIVDSKSQSLMAKTGSQSQSNAKATKELEVDLLHWCHCFKEWISTQKAYSEALNGWLMKWLPEELEQTADGVAPFSPGRIGAPAVYIISNDWFHAIKSISEDKATDAMHDFSVVAHKLWESQNREQHLRLKAEYLSRDYDRRHKSLQQVSGMNGRMDLVSVTENGEEHHDDQMTELDLMKKRLEEAKAEHQEIVKQVQDAASSILQTGLIPIFEALKTFSSATLKAYEGLRLPKESGP